MKATENKTNSSSQRRSAPFFQKGKGQSFFSHHESDRSQFFGSKHHTTPVIQTKLTIGKPNDKYEKEADTMAEKVVKGLKEPSGSKEIQLATHKPLAASITPLVQKKCDACKDEELQRKEDNNEEVEEVQRKPIFESTMRLEQENGDIQRKCDHCQEEEKTLQKKENTSQEGGSGVSLESQLNSTKNKGTSLPDDIKDSMGHAFGADFSNIRIHSDSGAIQMSKQINAQAFTHGTDIYFNAGKYQPHVTEGKNLLAHELTHTLQQSPNTLIQRVPCQTDAVECANHCGLPGQFVEAGERSAEAARSSRSAEITADPVAARGTGHSRRAVNLEQLARTNGLYPRPWIYGIFVDLDMPSTYGAFTTTCRSFSTWTTPQTYPHPDVRCVFFHDADEQNAGEFIRNPAATVIGGSTRNDWQTRTLRLISHEIQHVAFNTQTHAAPPVGSGCNRATSIYTDSAGRSYTVDYLLSEISAEVSEFIHIYNRHDRSNPPLWVRSLTDEETLRTLEHQRYQLMMTGASNDFRYRIDGCGEAIRGILRALRCHCACNEVEFFVRDTINFTIAPWPRHVRDFFQDMMRTQFPGLRWPL